MRGPQLTAKGNGSESCATCFRVERFGKEWHRLGDKIIFLYFLIHTCRIFKVFFGVKLRGFQTFRRIIVHLSQTVSSWGKTAWISYYWRLSYYDYSKRRKTLTRKQRHIPEARCPNHTDVRITVFQYRLHCLQVYYGLVSGGDGGVGGGGNSGGSGDHEFVGF